MTSELDPTKDQAAAEASALKDTVKTEAADLGSTAKGEAKQVAAEVKYQARGVLDESVSQLRSQAATGQNRLAEVVRDLAREAGQMAGASDANGAVTRLAGDASRIGDDVASWLDSRNPEDVLDDVRRFAARRPGTFLALAAGAGFLAGRFIRGMQSDADQPRALESGRRGLYDQGYYERAQSTYNQGQYAPGNQYTPGSQYTPGASYTTDTQPAQGEGHLYSYSDDEQRLGEQNR